MENEFHKLIKSVIILDIVSYTVSTLYIGFTLKFFLGLLLGTAAYIATLFSLRDSVLRSIAHGTKNARKIMGAGYGLRMLIVSAAVWLGLVFSVFNIIGVIVPLFCTKITVFSKSVFSYFFKK